MNPTRTLFLIVLLAVAARPAPAQQRDSVEALKRLSLDQLMNVEVMSVALRPQRLFETPSAIQVITQDEIRQSGATSLPEALRLASNLQVAQVDARQWAISARGFNSTTANKLLVLIDGRTVYTPLFSGVFWDVQGCARKQPSEPPRRLVRWPHRPSEPWPHRRQRWECDGKMGASILRQVRSHGASLLRSHAPGHSGHLW